MNGDMNKSGNAETNKNGTKDRAKEERLEVERAVGEGMDTPPRPTRGRDLGAEAAKVWSQLVAMLKDRPAQVLGVVAGVSFIAGVFAGRIRRS